MNEVFYLTAGPWPGRLGILSRPRGGDWLEDEVRGWSHLGIDVVVSLLTQGETEELELKDEARLCLESGVEFVNLPVPDRGVPPARKSVLDLTGRLDAHLSNGKTVGIHCRQGLGRSGLLAACLLVGTGMSPVAAFERLSASRGQTVPETREQREWVEHFAPQLVRHEGR